MVNEINSIGTTSAQGLGYTNAMQPGPPRSQGDSTQQPTMPPSVNVGARQGAYAALASAKDDAALVAKQVKDTRNTLQQANSVLGELADSTQMVKNFPPFPPGNDQRLNYLKGINGLRKELDALTYPPQANPNAPIFYPRSSDLPDLEPKTASDQQIVELGQAAIGIQTRVQESLKQLQISAEQTVIQFGSNIPAIPVSVSDAGQLADDTAVRLSQTNRPITSGGQSVAYLGG